MSFQITSEQKMLIETVRRFVYEELVPLEEGIEATGKLAPELARKVFEKSSSLGLYGMNIPEQYGGGGLSAVDSMLVEEQFGHTKDILIRRAFGNVYEILLAGNEAQIDRWLRPTVTGERVGSIAITEPGAGSDAGSIKTRAVKTGDKWRLSGNKHFISDGEVADYFIVSAVTDPEAKPKHISVFLVDRDAKGLTVGRDQPMMGLSGTSHNELYFDDVELEEINLIGGEGNGLRLALENLARVRLAQVAARAVGKSCRLLNLMVDYANQRQQFGKSIGEFQMIQQMIADSVIEINAARLLVLKAAAEIDAGQHKTSRDSISMVKIYASETLGKVADRAVQVYGGMGYCEEMPVARMYRDARIFRIFDGTSEIHRMVVARSTLNRGAGNPALYDIGA